MRDFVFLLERQPYYFMYEKSKKDRCERMKKLEQLYEGKAKKVFATDDPDIVIVDYKDDATDVYKRQRLWCCILRQNIS